MTTMTKKEKFALADVTLNVTTNPKKKGSMSYDRFQGYFKCVEAFPEGFTIQDAIDAGLRADDFRHDEAHGFITIERLPEDEA